MGTPTSKDSLGSVLSGAATLSLALRRYPLTSLAHKDQREFSVPSASTTEHPHIHRAQFKTRQAYPPPSHRAVTLPILCRALEPIFNECLEAAPHRHWR